MPRGWRWPVMALLVDLLVRQLTSGHLMGVATAAVLLLIVGVTIVWTAVDARPMLALILLAEARVWLAGLDTEPWSWDVRTWLSAVVSLAPLMAVFWRLRRQSVL
jgi:hypothetical protein